MIDEQTQNFWQQVYEQSQQIKPQAMLCSIETAREIFGHDAVERVLRRDRLRRAHAARLVARHFARKR
jgi:hypothetical protein